MNDSENISDPNKRNYFNPVSPAEKNKLYDSLATKKTKIIIWLKNKEDDAETFLTDGVLKDQSIILKKEIKIFSKIKKSSFTNNSVLVKFTFNNDSYFSNGHLYKKEKLLLKLEKIFIHKKRKDFRLEACSVIALQIKIDDEVFDAKDISAGGVCFITSKENKERFQINNIFTECKLRINRERFEIPQIQIVKSSIFSNARREEQLLVAIQFINLPESVDNLLCKHIHIEARGLILAKEF